MNAKCSFCSVQNSPALVCVYHIITDIIVLLIIVTLFQVFALLVVFRHNGGIRRNSNVINYV